LKNLKSIDFYFVTWPSISKNGILTDVKNALSAGCKIIQYREKNKSTKDMLEEAKLIKNLCKKRSIFLVNDRVDIAYSIDADGVHIGRNDIPIKTAREILGQKKIIGFTVNNLEEAIQVEKQGVDYIGLAPIYQTKTKDKSSKPCGIDIIKIIRENISIPIVAVGGINKYNVMDVISMGADSVVAVSAVLKSNNIYAEINNFIRIINEVKSNDTVNRGKK
jgi:thiamine-phosphate pyrophosphorylase